MKGNFHARFLGGRERATARAYPVPLHTPCAIMSTKAKKKRNLGESIWLGCFALVVFVMLYGVICYPYAPIRLRDDGHYRDKNGREFTEAQFHSFATWERCLLGSFAVVAAASIPLAIARHRRRAR